MNGKSAAGADYALLPGLREALRICARCYRGQRNAVVALESRIAEIEAATAKRVRQNVYLPESAMVELEAEAERQDRSISKLVEACVEAAMPKIKKLAGRKKPHGNTP